MQHYQIKGGGAHEAELSTNPGSEVKPSPLRALPHIIISAFYELPNMNHCPLVHHVGWTDGMRTRSVSLSYSCAITSHGG